MTQVVDRGTVALFSNLNLINRISYINFVYLINIFDNFSSPKVISFTFDFKRPTFNLCKVLLPHFVVAKKPLTVIVKTFSDGDLSSSEEM